MTDSGLASIRGLNQLEELNLSGTRIGDAGLANLRGLSQLQMLAL